MELKNDLTGKRFGRLYVIKRVENEKIGGQSRVTYLCQCDCGNQTKVIYDNLKRQTRSCGCLKKEKLLSSVKKHGMFGTKIYQTWSNMLNRCRNRNVPCYKDYGERGIKVCNEWEDFKNFYKWALENGYKDGLTIERIDVNGNYEPNNCKFIELKEQAYNKRNSFKITYKGETKQIKYWAGKYNISRDTLYQRIVSLKWNVEDALLKPVKKIKK